MGDSDAWGELTAKAQAFARANAAGLEARDLASEDRAAGKALERLAASGLLAWTVPASMGGGRCQGLGGSQPSLRAGTVRHPR